MQKLMKFVSMRMWKGGPSAVLYLKNICEVTGFLYKREGKQEEEEKRREGNKIV